MTLHTQPLIVSSLLAGLLLAGCAGFGRVNQGQVVAYDRQQGLITLIADSNYLDPANPRFDVLPPATIRIPASPGEMGPEPEPGRLLKLDYANRRLTLFDPVAQSLKTISYEPVEQRLKVASGDPRVARARFPLIDRQRKTITVYGRRQQALVTFTVPDEYFNLPAETWRVGDEVRYYYKDPSRALRLMNVTKTEIGKAGK